MESSLIITVLLLAAILRGKGSGSGVIGVNHDKAESLDFKPGDKIKIDPASGRLVKISADSNGE